MSINTFQCLQESSTCSSCVHVRHVTRAWLSNIELFNTRESGEREWERGGGAGGRWDKSKWENERRSRVASWICGRLVCCRRRGKQAQMEATAYPGIWSSSPVSEHNGSENYTGICLIHSLEFVSVSVQTAVTRVNSCQRKVLIGNAAFLLQRRVMCLSGFCSNWNRFMYKCVVKFIVCI